MAHAFSFASAAAPLQGPCFPAGPDSSHVPATSVARMKKNSLVWRAGLLLSVLCASGCAPGVKRLDSVPSVNTPALAAMQSGVAEASAQMTANMDLMTQRLETTGLRLETELVVPPADDPLTRKTVSLSMQDARAGQLLWVLASEFGLSLSIDPAVLNLPQVSNLHLQKVTGRQALDHILENFDLYGKVSPDNVLVVKLMDERTFDVEALTGKSALSVGVGGDVFGSSGKDGGSTLKDNLSLAGDYGDKVDGSEQLMKSLEAILADEPGAEKSPGKEKPRLTLDRSGGILYVRARPSRMRAIEGFIEQGKRFRGRQIQIDAQLLDVQVSDGTALGIDWNLLGNRIIGRFGAGAASLSPLTTALVDGAGLNGRSITIPAQAVGVAGSTAAGIAVANNTFSAAVSALRTFGTVKLLSNPTIRVRNGVPAYLSVGNNIRYIQKLTSNSTNTGGTTTTSTDVVTDSLFSGVVLGVSAVVKNDGFVELFVRPSQTQVQEKSLIPYDVGSGNKVTLPIINTKSITTTLNIRNGDTIVIGGLIDQQLGTSNSDVPGLSDAPGIGRLFGNSSNDHVTRELVVVLRARVL